MRVLLVNPAGQLGGGERSLLDLIGAVDRGVDFSLLLTEDGPLVDKARSLGVKVKLLPMPKALLRLGDGAIGLASLAGAAAALPGYLASLREAAIGSTPDIVHSNGMKTHILMALALPRHLPLLWHIRDYPSARGVSRLVLGRLASRVTLVLANSDSVAADVRATLGAGVSVRRIYNGIDTRCFSPVGAALDLGPPGSVRIGLVATYARWKGHRLFLEAARRYLDMRPAPPPSRFYVVGGPVYRTEGSQIHRVDIEARARELGLEQVLEFLPFQADPAPVYRALDIVVNASTSPEPFGRTIVEALACGKPVVAARHGGACELLTGALAPLGFAPGDAGDLAQRLAGLAGDAEARQSFGRAGRLAVEERFAWSQLAGEVLQAYLFACPTR